MSKLVHRSEGFTLIELMIVILIIAILVAIAVPVYLNSRTNAERRTCQANQRTTDGAIMAYQADDSNQDFPADLDALMAAGSLKERPTCPSLDAPAEYSWVSGTPPFISCPYGHPSQDA